MYLCRVCYFQSLHLPGTQTTYLPVYAPHEIFAERYEGGLQPKREMGLQEFWAHGCNSEFAQRHPGNDDPRLWNRTEPYLIYGDGGEVHDGEKFWVFALKLLLVLGASLDTHFLIAMIPHRTVVTEAFSGM